jgi:hypothetical protein
MGKEGNRGIKLPFPPPGRKLCIPKTIAIFLGSLLQFSYTILNIYNTLGHCNKCSKMAGELVFVSSACLILEKSLTFFTDHWIIWPPRVSCSSHCPRSWIQSPCSCQKTRSNQSHQSRPFDASPPERCRVLDHRGHTGGGCI